MIDEEGKKELVPNEVVNKDDLVNLLQDNEKSMLECNNIHSETIKKNKKKVNFAENLVEIIDIQSFVDKKSSELKKASASTKKTSALDEFLSPGNTHTGNQAHTERVLKNIMKLDPNIVNSYKHCWLAKLFSDRCKKEDAVYRAYNVYKNSVRINEDDEIINLDNVAQQMSDCLNQWDAVC